MKKLFLLLMGVTVLCSCACVSRRNLGPETTSVRHSLPFNRIVIKGACDVKFAQGDSFNVKVVGPENLVSDVVTQFSGQTLTITTKEKHGLLNSGRRSSSPVVYVTSPDLIGLHMEGAGDFEVENLLDTDTLNLFLKGIGDINLKKVVCDELHATMLGMGDIDVEQLTSAHSVVQMKGVGDIKVHFVNSGSAVCTLEGVGDIELSGTLKSLQQNVHGTGDIDTDNLKLGTK